MNGHTRSNDKYKELLVRVDLLNGALASEKRDKQKINDLFQSEKRERKAMAKARMDLLADFCDSDFDPDPPRNMGTSPGSLWPKGRSY